MPIRFFKKNMRADHVARNLVENGIPNTKAMLAFLSSNKEKAWHEKAFHWLSFGGLGFHLFGAVFLALDKKYQYLSAEWHQITFVLLTIGVAAAMSVAFILGSIWFVELFRKGDEYQCNKVDRQIAQENRLLEALKQYSLSSEALIEHGNRLAFAVRQWRERTTLVAIFGAIAAGSQVLGTSMGFPLLVNLGWSCVIGGGLGAMLLKIHSDRFERLSRLILSANTGSVNVRYRTAISMRRDNALRGKE